MLLMHMYGHYGNEREPLVTNAPDKDEEKLVTCVSMS